MFMNLKNTLKENINKGFTLMETILVVAIIAILLGIGAVGVAQYMDNADELERMGAAQTLYMSLQNYLVEEQKAGRLDTFNAMVNAGNTSILFDYTLTTNKNNTIEKDILNANKLSLDAEFEAKHDATKIVAVFYDGENKNQNLYNLFVSLGVDTDILENQFLFEYNQTTGIVQAVFYTKETGVKFGANSYTTGAAGSKNNVLDRSTAAIDVKKQGYYGLYETSALSEKVERILDAKVMLVNDDRIYLVFRDELPNGGGNLNKKVNLYLAGSDKELGKQIHVHQSQEVSPIMPISQILDQLDTHGGSKKGNDNQVSARHIKLDDNTAVYFVVLSCLDDNEFLNYAKSGDLGQNPEKSEVYVSLSLGGLEQKSNTINPFFASVESEGTEDIYNLSCSRHLANLNKVKEINSTLDWKSLHYRVVDDINMMQYEREENHLPEVLSTVLGVPEDEILAESTLGRDGVSKVLADATDLKDRHFIHAGIAPITFGETGNDMQYFNGVFEGAENTNGTKYSITGVTLVAESSKENGFFKLNKGTVQNLAFKKATVYSGFCAGIVCGRNNGNIHDVDIEEFVVAHERDDLKNLGTKANYDEKTVSDYSHKVTGDGLLQKDSESKYDGSMVGGICGISYRSIKNCSAKRGIVYGEESYGGGIVGWAYAKEKADDDVFTIEDCTVKDCFVSVTAKSGGIVGHCEFKIKDCQVLKEDDSELLPVGLSYRPTYTTSDARTRLTEEVYPCVVANRNSSRAGGIAGLANNSIENCVNYLDVCQRFDVGTADPGATQMQNVGGIVAILGVSKTNSAGCVIKNCTNYGSVTSYQEGILTKFVGGIVGISYFPIDNCTNYGSVAGVNSECVGGIAGGTYKDITNCKVLAPEPGLGKAADTLTIAGRKYVGGIVGIANSGKIENCYVGCEKDASGNIVKKNGSVKITPPAYYSTKYNIESVGGICGVCNPVNLTEYKISSCANYGDIEIGTQINTVQCCGGILGRSYNNIYVDSCENDGSILANVDNGNMQYCGGIVGWQNKTATSLSITNSVNRGNFNFSSLVSDKILQCCGGIFGDQEGSSQAVMLISSCKNYGDFYSSEKLGDCGGIFSRAITSYNHTFYDLYNYGDIVAVKSISTVGGITSRLTPNMTDSLFDDAHNEGNIIAGTSCTNVGGIVGIQKEWKGITNVSNAGDIIAGTSLNQVGGILGDNIGTLTIITAVNTGKLTAVTSVSNTGGIVGHSNKDTSLENHLTSVRNEGEIFSGTSMTGVGGIFGKVEGSSVNEITGIENENTNVGTITATTTMTQTGGIVGYLVGTSNTFTHVTNAGTISTTGTGTMSKTGGIAGEVTKALSLTVNETTKTNTNSNVGTISANAAMSQVGGVIGQVDVAYTASYLNNSGKITGIGQLQDVGGIIGKQIGGGNYTGFSNSGTIEGKTTLIAVGGILGNANGGSSITISSSTNSGTITSGSGHAKQVGGINGYNSETNSVPLTVTIKSCTNTGAISMGFTAEGIGGIVGYSASGTTSTELSDVKNLATISTEGNVTKIGGIGGYISGKSKVNGAENDGTIQSKGTLIEAGGILGRANNECYIGNASDASIKCINKGNILPGVDGSKDLGGIIGFINKRNFEINYAESNCSIGITNISDSDAKYVLLSDAGGILGRTENVSSAAEGKNYKGIINHCTANINISALGVKNEGIGGIAGYTRMSVDFLNCSVTGTLVAKQMGVGGLAGACVSNSIMYTNVENCTTDVQILVKAAETDNDKYAGLIAYAKTNLNIKNCETKGDIKADPGIPLKNASGYLGYCTTADTVNGGVTMTGCKSYVNIYTDNKLIRGAGLFSNIDGIATADIHDNYAMGNITYGYAGMSGGLGGRLDTKISGEMYNCYYGGKIKKLSADMNDKFSDSYINSSGDTQTGYLIGQVVFEKKGVFRDCYVYQNCVEIGSGTYTGYEHTPDTDLLTIRRIAGVNKQDIFPVDSANIVYQTHRNSPDAEYRNSAILNETEFKKLCFLFEIPSDDKFTGDPEKDIQYLMSHYIVSIKNAEDWEGKDHDVRTVTFKLDAPDGYKCTITYGGYTLGFEDNSLTLPTVVEEGKAAPILNGQTLNFKINDANAGEETETNKIKNTDLIVVNWVPEGGSDNLIKPEGDVYTVTSVNKDGVINIVIKEAPVVTYKFQFEGGADVEDVSKYLSLESIVGMEQFVAGEYRYHVTEPEKKVSFTTRTNKDQAGYLCKVEYSSTSTPTVKYLNGGGLTDAISNVTVPDDGLEVKYTLIRCPVITMHYKDETGADVAYSNFDVSNKQNMKKYGDFSDQFKSVYTAMKVNDSTKCEMNIKLKEGYKYILFDKDGTLRKKIENENYVLDLSTYTDDVDFYLVRYPAITDLSGISSMPVKIRINLETGDGYTWESAYVDVAGENADGVFKTTEDVTVAFTVTATGKEVDSVKIGETNLTPVSKGENEYEVTIPSGTPEGAGKVIFKPDDITFTLSSGDGYKWEGENNSIDVPGTNERKTAQSETVVLIVTNAEKVLDQVKLGDNTLDVTGPETVDGGAKYTITIPAGSLTGTITVTLKEKDSEAPKKTVDINKGDGVGDSVIVKALDKDGNEVPRYDPTDLGEDIVAFKVALANSDDENTYTVNGTEINKSNPSTDEIPFPSGDNKLTIEIAQKPDPTPDPTP